jgi:hypothetical protein
VASLQGGRRDTVIFGARNNQVSMLAPHTPKQNHVLAALPATDYERRLPGLEQVLLEPGRARYASGRITVLDRPKLEARVRVCYAVVKQESDRLFSRKTVIVDQVS